MSRVEPAIKVALLEECQPGTIVWAVQGDLRFLAFVSKYGEESNSLVSLESFGTTARYEKFEHIPAARVSEKCVIPYPNQDYRFTLVCDSQMEMPVSSMLDKWGPLILAGDNWYFRVRQSPYKLNPLYYDVNSGVIVPSFQRGSKTAAFSNWKLSVRSRIEISSALGCERLSFEDVTILTQSEQPA